MSILSFQDVEWSTEGGIPLRPFSFSLGPGETALIRIGPEDRSLPLGDLAEGIVAPSAGCVRFLGKDWREYTAHEGAGARGSIRRVFRSDGWLSNLDVDENVTLAQRHHTPRPAAEIEEEAERWARRFGMDGLPRMRPALAEPGDLRRAEWVRAFLGTPALMILEEPMRDVRSDRLPALAQALRQARDRGAAVLWMTAEPAASVEGLDPASRWIVENGTARRE